MLDPLPWPLPWPLQCPLPLALPDPATGTGPVTEPAAPPAAVPTVMGERGLEEEEGAELPLPLPAAPSHGRSGTGSNSLNCRLAHVPSCGPSSMGSVPPLAQGVVDAGPTTAVLGSAGSAGAGSTGSATGRLLSSPSAPSPAEPLGARRGTGIALGGEEDSFGVRPAGAEDLLPDRKGGCGVGAAPGPYSEGDAAALPAFPLSSGRWSGLGWVAGLWVRLRKYRKDVRDNVELGATGGGSAPAAGVAAGVVGGTGDGKRSSRAPDQPDAQALPSHVQGPNLQSGSRKTAIWVTVAVGVRISAGPAG